MRIRDRGNHRGYIAGDGNSGVTWNWTNEAAAQCEHRLALTMLLAEPGRPSQPFGVGRNPRRTRPSGVIPLHSTWVLVPLFNLMLEDPQHIALVVYEYWGRAGSFTLRDVVETLLVLKTWTPYTPSWTLRCSPDWPWLRAMQVQRGTGEAIAFAAHGF